MEIDLRRREFASATVGVNYLIWSRIPAVSGVNCIVQNSRFAVAGLNYPMKNQRFILAKLLGKDRSISKCSAVTPGQGERIAQS